MKKIAKWAILVKYNEHLDYHSIIYTGRIEYVLSKTIQKHRLQNKMMNNQATATPTQKDSRNSDAQYSNNQQTQSNKHPRVSSSTSTDDVYINQNEMQEIIKNNSKCGP